MAGNILLKYPRFSYFSPVFGIKNGITYWRKLKQRLKAEVNETVTNCNALKLRAADRKMRMTDVADTEPLFRLIQSIPSPKAEPFKRWMAQVAAERLDQLQDPELSIEQAGSTTFCVFAFLHFCIFAFSDLRF